jgi:hypothetical protein
MSLGLVRLTVTRKSELHAGLSQSPPAITYTFLGV